VLAGAQITQLRDHRRPDRHFLAIMPNGGDARGRLPGVLSTPCYLAARA
jgi:hypothetical protein